jgi:hypothetical protein
MKWSDIAPYIGPTPNERPGGMESIEGVVLHIQQGNEAGSIAWCQNPASQVSAHFFAPKVGRPVQMVDTSDEAWAEAAGNARWLSIENEGYSGQQLTADQIEACAQILARAHTVYGVALVATDDPARGGLGWHGMGGDPWGGHPDCPGEPVKAQRAEIIARAAAIVGLPNPPATSAPPFPGRTLVYSAESVPQMHGADVSTWQDRMRARGWSITVDGWYGPQSWRVCEDFQRDSTAHGWYLQVDGMVGPHTWSAAWERPVS